METLRISSVVTKTLSPSNSLFKLHKGGSIWRWSGEGTNWDNIDNNQFTKAIAAGGSKVYHMRIGRAIFVYNGKTWDMLDSNPDTIQIAAGNAGIYQLHKEHTIWKHTSDGWKGTISSDRIVIEISVTDSVYSRKEGGEVIKI
jgi:hypothetical protein